MLNITLRSDHLPLKNFLAKNTLSLKMNKWAIEICPFRITFEYIKGIKNTLADTMSRRISINPTIKPESEPEGYKFGYYVFDPLLPMSVESTDKQINGMKVKQIDDENKIELGILPHNKLVELQSQDEQCTKLVRLIKENKMPLEKAIFSEGRYPV